MIDNPVSTLAVFAGFALLAYVFSIVIPDPIDKCIKLIKILMEEGDPRKKNNWLQRINFASIILFGVIIILQIVIWGGTSIMGQIIPEGNQETPTGIIISTISLFFIGVISPYLIYRIRRDSAIYRKSKRFIDDD